MIGRREFITLVGGATAWPGVARAQQAAMPVIGFLSSRSPGDSAGVVAAFRQGLGASGFVEGQNVVIAFRWAEGRYDRLPVLAAELVDLRVAALSAAGGPPSALAAKAATRTSPIVFSAVNDPVRAGLVPSLNRPGGNITGMSFLNFEIIGKSAQLLKEMVPAAAAIAYLVNPSSPSAEIYAKQAPAVASALGIRVPVLNASTEHDLDEGFASLGKIGADALSYFGGQYARHGTEPGLDRRTDAPAGERYGDASPTGAATGLSLCSQPSKTAAEKP
jgi:putative ABC transport system substrate-binding protein